MSAELLLREFERIGDAPDAIASLRQFLLELAVRGQLSPQEPNDTSPQNLLSDLAGLGHGHQEADKSLQRFTVPTSWCWATVSDVSEHQLGKMLNTPKMKGVGRRYLRSVNIRKDGSIALTDLNEMLLPETEFDKYSVEFGDVFVIEGGDVGRNAMWRDQSSEPLAFQNQLHRLRVRSPFHGRFFQLTIEHARQTGLLLDLAAGVTIKHLSATSLRSLPVPVPPVEEQYRIVSTFDALMKLCDQLELAQKGRELQRDALRGASLYRLTSADDTEGTAANVRFFLDKSPRLVTKAEHVDEIRQCIRDLAVRGRLVEHDAGSDPASYVPDRLANETVTPGLFPNPRDWHWGTLGSVSTRIHYGYTASADFSLRDIRLLRITDIQNGRVNWDSVPGCAISEDEAAKYLLSDGDVLIARTGGTMGKSFLVTDTPVRAIFASYLIRVQPSPSVDQDYVKLFLDSPLYWQQLSAASRGTGQPNVNGKTLGALSIPLPPLGEQRLIVERVNSLMVLCEKLEETFASAETDRGRLLEALLHDALSGKDEKIAFAVAAEGSD